MPRRLLLLLAALTVLAMASLAGIATAATTGVGAQNRIGAFQADGPSFVGPQQAESSCTHEGSVGSTAGMTSGFCVAAEGEDGLPGVGDTPTKVVNTGMGHASTQALGRLGFESVGEARSALQELGEGIESDGFPEGTIPDTARDDRLLVPFGDDGYAVYQIKPNGNAVLKTVLNQLPPTP